VFESTLVLLYGVIYNIAVKANQSNITDQKFLTKCFSLLGLDAGFEVF